MEHSRTMTSQCEDCGADPGVLGCCRDVFHALLAAEHADPRLGRWHGPMVAAYLLQHPVQGVVRFRDHQFRILQLLRARGLDGFHDFAAGQRRRNSHQRDAPPDFDQALDGFDPLPDARPPTSFDVTIQELPGSTGDFSGDGYDAYDRRLMAFVVATLDGLGGASRRLPG